MKIIFVKKIKIDGAPCRKCRDVAEKLDKDGITPLINETWTADERDKTTAVWEFIDRNKIERAPFFIVRDKYEEKIFITYFDLKKYLLEKGALSQKDSIKPTEVDYDTPDDLYYI